MHVSVRTNLSATDSATGAVLRVSASSEGQDGGGGGKTRSMKKKQNAKF